MRELWEEVVMPLAKNADVRRPSRFLWTPDGLVDLGELHDLRKFQPTLFGTFEPPEGESTPSDVVPHRACGAFEDSCSFCDVDEHLAVGGYSSHDSDPMLG